MPLECLTKYICIYIDNSATRLTIYSYTVSRTLNVNVSEMFIEGMLYHECGNIYIYICIYECVCLFVV